MVTIHDNSSMKQSEWNSVIIWRDSDIGAVRFSAAGYKFFDGDTLTSVRFIIDKDDAQKILDDLYDAFPELNPATGRLLDTVMAVKC
jgi:hypothetical protein